ncbi:MAG TPA: ATP-binding protein [Solirubrobacteraceae bacterium]|nr:ATP-binding protein [Solirubrobacteraceae bacterium]
MAPPDAISATCRTLLLQALNQADAPPQRRRSRAAAAVAEPLTMEGFADPPGAADILDHGSGAFDARLGTSPGGTPGALSSGRPVLGDRVRERLEHVILEHRAAAALRDRGVSPTGTVLLSGAPGVGKTMTAAWIAAELGRELLAIEPASVMTSMLGESARNLSAALSRARAGDVVVLLDELDALAKRRDDPLDVGEHKRLVSTLLLELDRWPQDHLLIAATNHTALLDPALARRFELVIELDGPDARERLQILSQNIERHGLTITGGARAVAVELLEDATGAAIARAVRDAARAHVLDDADVDWALLRACLPSRPAELPRAARARFASIAKREASLTTRAIGELLGCSHTAVQKLLAARVAGE